MFRTAAAIALLASTSLCCTASWAATPPSQMQHIVIRYTEPKPEANSFGAQPKDYTRAGDSYGRVAEAPDPAMHLHQLLLINAPDCWICELYSKKGKHMLTPTNEMVRFPIFPGRGPAAKKLLSLEFGKELEFFKQQHAAKTSAKDAKGQPIDQYSFPISADLTVVLNVDPKTSKPEMISMKHKAQAMTLEYVTYETVPFQASMFKPPAGIEITEVKVKQMAPPPANNAPTGATKPDDKAKPTSQAAAR